MFLFKFLFPVGNIQGRPRYIWTIKMKTSAYGDAMTTSACLPIERAWYRNKVSASS